MKIFDLKTNFLSFCVRINDNRRNVFWLAFHRVPGLNLLSFLISVIMHTSTKLSKNQWKIDKFHFLAISSLFMLNKDSSLTLLFRQILVILPMIGVLHVFLFRHNSYLKTRQNFSKKMKIFEYSSIYQSFCVRNNIPKGLIG